MCECLCNAQVAMERTRPHGRVVGIDLIPAQPPRGVATFQGDFLSPQVQALVRDFILRTHKPRSGPPPKRKPAEDGDGRSSSSDVGEVSDAAAAGEALAQPSYIDQERHMGEVPEANSDATPAKSSGMAIVDVSCRLAGADAWAAHATHPLTLCTARDD